MFEQEEVAPQEEVKVGDEVTTPDEAQENPEESQSENQETPSEEESLKAEIEELKAKLADTYDHMLRIQADFDNFRKRSQKQKDELAQYTKEEFIKALLPVLDNFDLALSHADTENFDAFKKGVELVAKQFKEALEREGLSEVEAENTSFDPNFHHGVAVDNNPDLQDGYVSEVLQKGYQVNDKVIRPAMVKVNQLS